jgi:hypothetical protein
LLKIEDAKGIEGKGPFGDLDRAVAVNIFTSVIKTGASTLSITTFGIMTLSIAKRKCDIEPKKLACLSTDCWVYTQTLD